MPDCLLALGSNLGQRRATLTAAVDALRNWTDIKLLRCSNWHRTQPVGGPSGQGAYLNGAATVRTTLQPHELLEVCHQIEADFGRQRNDRWAARTLDIDLLFYGDEIIDEPELTVPHPRLADRRFVLAPAAEIAADWKHPQLGKTIRELLLQLDQRTVGHVECEDGP